MERLEKELREEWEQQHREKLHNLQQLYQESLQLLGQGHRDAKENVRTKYFIWNSHEYFLLMVTSGSEIYIQKKQTAACQKCYNETR